CTRITNYRGYFDYW
nr:immunoglobulin heavy chain junction region [Mus musculus]